MVGVGCKTLSLSKRKAHPFLPTHRSLQALTSCWSRHGAPLPSSRRPLRPRTDAQRGRGVSGGGGAKQQQRHKRARARTQNCDPAAKCVTCLSPLLATPWRSPLTHRPLPGIPPPTNAHREGRGGHRQGEKSSSSARTNERAHAQTSARTTRKRGMPPPTPTPLSWRVPPWLVSSGMRWKRKEKHLSALRSFAFVGDAVSFVDAYSRQGGTHE